MVELIVTLIKHRYAEDIFSAAFNALDLDSLFPWHVKPYYNTTCKLECKQLNIPNVHKHKYTKLMCFFN